MFTEKDRKEIPLVDALLKKVDQMDEAHIDRVFEELLNKIQEPNSDGIFTNHL